MSHGHDAAPAPARGPIQFIVNILYVAMCPYSTFTSRFVGAFDPLIQRGLFIGLGVGLVFFVNQRTAKEKGSWNMAIDSVLALSGFTAACMWRSTRTASWTS
ncbi:MAG: hypothetical protein U1E97_00390 [Alphaproteobacteria bacterium]